MDDYRSVLDLSGSSDVTAKDVYQTIKGYTSDGCRFYTAGLVELIEEANLSVWQLTRARSSVEEGLQKFKDEEDTYKSKHLNYEILKKYLSYKIDSPSEELDFTDEMHAFTSFLPQSSEQDSKLFGQRLQEGYNASVLCGFMAHNLSDPNTSHDLFGQYEFLAKIFHQKITDARNSLYDLHPNSRPLENSYEIVGQKCTQVGEFRDFFQNQSEVVDATKSALFEQIVDEMDLDLGELEEILKEIKEEELIMQESQ